MSKFKQRLAGVFVLTIVSVVSLLAGGIILGGASADDGDANGWAIGKDGITVGNIMKFAPADLQGGVNVRVTSNLDKDGGQSCVIAFGAAGEDLRDLPAFDGKDLPKLELQPAQGGAPVEIRTFSSELKPGEAAPTTVAVQAKPLAEEDIAKLKAAGEIKELNPADCAIVNPELMPEGWTPAKPLGVGIGGAPAAGATFNIVTTKP